MPQIRAHSTRVTASADVKAFGGPATIRKIFVQNNGTASTAGFVEVRDAQATPGDTGTLRFDIRYDDVAADSRADVDFCEGGLDMPEGIRITLNTVTNVVVWVIWEG